MTQFGLLHAAARQSNLAHERRESFAAADLFFQQVRGHMF